MEEFEHLIELIIKLVGVFGPFFTILLIVFGIYVYIKVIRGNHVLVMKAPSVDKKSVDLPIESPILNEFCVQRLAFCLEKFKDLKNDQGETNKKIDAQNDWLRGISENVGKLLGRTEYLEKGGR